MNQHKPKDVQIDLKAYGSTIFTGRKNGLNARNYYKLDEYDENTDLTITVVFPSNISVLASSFLLGMLSTSIQKQKTRENFERKFKFPGLSENFKSSLDEAIERALRKKVSFDGI